MKHTVQKMFGELKQSVGSTKYYTLFVSVILLGIITPLEPLFFGKIISELEEFYTTGVFDIHQITSITIFWGAFILGVSLFQYYVWQYIITKAALIDYKEGIKTYCLETLDMSMKEYLGKKIGSVYKLIDRGTENKLFFFFHFFDIYLFNTIQISVIVIILLFLDVSMALISLILLPIMILLGAFFVKVTSKHQDILSKKWEEIFEIVGNAMSNFGLYKTLSLQKDFSSRIIQKADETYTKQMHLNKYWNISEIYSSIIVMLTRIGVLGYGIYLVQKGELTLASLFVIFSYIGWIYFPLGFMFRNLRTTVKQVTETKRLYEELGNLEKDTKADTGKVLKNISGNIELKNVCFGYANAKNILSQINLSIQVGEKIALVGNTGAGKSTIVNLLLRFWEVTQGEILLDGHNIQTLKKSSLRNHIGVVSQDNSLFNLSIAENLLLASPKATAKDIKAALISAEAEFVYDLPNGIDTIIGERGLKLSGGEKQRISIARLFLKNPEVLILDEATSALDNITEQKIEKALKKLMKGKTSIIIAHRLSTIRHVDKIFVLEKGRIVEVGNYEALIEKKGKFYNLANPDKLILG